MCGGDDFDKTLQKEIDRQIAKKKAGVHREFKLLLLGTGESGKSTILKQMQIIYGKEFDDVEFRKSYTALVYKNLLRSMVLIYEASTTLNLPIADSTLAGKVAKMVAIRDETFDTLEPAQAQTFIDFWVDKDVQELYSRRNEYYLPDSTKYFYQRVGQISDAAYVPDKNDIVRTRQATTGIHEYAFDIKDNNIVFRMIDVGGQRSERRKWIHCFEHVTSIIFIVASSEYDQFLIEDGTKNRMEESIALFQHIVTYQWFRKATFILFLNKKDLLEEKIEGGKSPFGKFFPKSPAPHNTPFTGDGSSVTSVQAFIQQMYIERAGSDIGEQDRVFCHPTKATDTDQIEIVFAKVKKTIMLNALKSYNLT